MMEDGYVLTALEFEVEVQNGEQKRVETLKKQMGEGCMRVGWRSQDVTKI